MTDSHPHATDPAKHAEHHIVRPHATLDTMVMSIEHQIANTGHRTGCLALSHRVHDALHSVLREAFVPPEIRQFAYISHALPIGHRQTMPEPFLIALMTELLDLEPQDIVLEIGTGSGYQTAILAKLTHKVYSIELVPQLAGQAQATLQHLGYANVEMRTGDGAAGWPEHGPYDAIVMTAPTPEIPPALIDQLKPGGHLVAAVGPADDKQTLTTVFKQQNGQVARNRLLTVQLVPPPHPAAAAQHAAAAAAHGA